MGKRFKVLVIDNENGRLIVDKEVGSYESFIKLISKTDNKCKNCNEINDGPAVAVCNDCKDDFYAVDTKNLTCDFCQSKDFSFLYDSAYCSSCMHFMSKLKGGKHVQVHPDPIGT